MPSSTTPADATPPGRYHVAHYGKSRNFALYEGKNLLAVTLYKKGAETLQGELEARDKMIAEQAARIEQLTDFSVMLFRPNFMLVSEEYPMKTHKNQ